MSKEYHKIEENTIGAYLGKLNDASKEGWTVDKVETLVVDRRGGGEYAILADASTIHIAHLSREVDMNAASNPSMKPTQEQLKGLMNFCRWGKEGYGNAEWLTIGVETLMEDGTKAGTIKVYTVTHRKNGGYFQVTDTPLLGLEMTDHMNFRDACKLAGYGE